MSPITWFDDSPDAGSDFCICSWCGKKIEAIEETGELPLRVFSGEGPDMKEARFHPVCFFQAQEIEGTITEPIDA